ncbi:MAG: hypothetical protein ACE5MB_04050 [Anaerolineae bacterium]
MRSFIRAIAVPDDTLTYTITLSNTGDEEASPASVTDPVPANTSYMLRSASATSGVITDTEGIQWTGPITPGLSVTIIFQVAMDSHLAEPTAIVNVATIEDGVNPFFDSIYLPLITR